MARRQLKEPETNSFEALHGAQPFAVLAEHSGGEFIAMLTMPPNSYGERAAVWSAKTRKIVWLPRDVHALCWTADGKEVLLARKFYERDPEKHDIIVTPLQSEYSHFLERRTWPHKDLRSYSEIDLPTGWITELIPSPTGRLICCVWHDQGEAGIELFSVAGKEVCQLHGKGYYGEESHLMESPAFSPDGRYLIFTYTNYAWWSPDDPETASLGGKCIVGWIVVGDMEVLTYRVIEVDKVLAKGWLPADPDGFCDVLMSPASFTDQDHFKIVLPTGEERCYSASECQVS